MSKLNTLQVVVVPVEGKLDCLVLKVFNCKLVRRLKVMSNKIELQGLDFLTLQSRRPIVVDIVIVM